MVFTLFLHLYQWVCVNLPFNQFWDSTRHFHHSDPFGHWGSLLHSPGLRWYGLALCWNKPTKLPWWLLVIVPCHGKTRLTRQLVLSLLSMTQWSPPKWCFSLENVGFEVLNLWTWNIICPAKMKKTDCGLPKPIYASWHSASLLVGQQSSGRTTWSRDELLQGRCMSSLFTVGPPPACLTCHQPHRLLTPQTWGA